jgi:hypothetical protein
MVHVQSVTKTHCGRKESTYLHIDELAELGIKALFDIAET